MLSRAAPLSGLSRAQHALLLLRRWSAVPLHVDAAPAPTPTPAVAAPAPAVAAPAPAPVPAMAHDAALLAPAPTLPRTGMPPAPLPLPLPALDTLHVLPARSALRSLAGTPPRARMPPPPPPTSTSTSTTSSTNPTGVNATTFSELPLAPELQRALAGLGFEAPFGVQAATLPTSLQGRDVIVRAVTGSGKTLAFALPIVQRLGFGLGTAAAPAPAARRSGAIKPRALVLAPTRELALQVQTVLATLEKAAGLQSVAVYGGASIGNQARDLRRGVDIVVGTPGRINDFLERGDLELDQVEVLALDEADEMLTPNFREQIEGMFRLTRPDRQTLLFSATIPPEIQRLTRSFMHDAVFMDLTTKETKTPSTVKHLAMAVRGQGERATVIGNLMQVHKGAQAMIFTNTRVRAAQLAETLTDRGIPAVPMHSDLSQALREMYLDRFRAGKVRAVVATDVAARGLDIPACELVIQDAPPTNSFEFYLHRAGRTGRAGRAGSSILLYHPDEDRSFLRQVARLVDIKAVPAPSAQEVALANMASGVKRVQEASAYQIATGTSEAQRLLSEPGVVVEQLLAAALAVASGLPAKAPSGAGGLRSGDGGAAAPWEAGGDAGGADGGDLRRRRRGRGGSSASSSDGFRRRSDRDGEGGFGGRDGRESRDRRDRGPRREFGNGSGSGARSPARFERSGEGAADFGGRRRERTGQADGTGAGADARPPRVRFGSSSGGDDGEAGARPRVRFGSSSGSDGGAPRRRDDRAPRRAFEDRAPASAGAMPHRAARATGDWVPRHR